MSETTMSRVETIDEVKAEVRELRVLLVQLGRETVEALLDAWRARLDNLRVQVDLAEMDGRDEVDHAVRRADETLRAVRARLDSGSGATDDVREILREGVASARADLGAAVELAEERIEAARPA